MQNQNFPDGFPMDAQAAIDNSYFLTSEEKSEWTEWLKQANLEQQNELVNTLHDIWIENQKQVIPAGFDTKQSSTQQISNENDSTPVQKPEPVIVEQPVVNIPIAPVVSNEVVAPKVQEIAQPIQEELPKSVETPKTETIEVPLQEPVRNERQNTRPAEKTQSLSRTENRASATPSTPAPAVVNNPRNENPQRINPNQQNSRPQRNQEQRLSNDRNRDRSQNRNDRNDRNTARNEERQNQNVQNERPAQTQVSQEVAPRESENISRKPFNLTSARAVATNDELTKLVQSYQLQQKSLQAARLQYEESLQKKEAQTEASFLTLMTRSIEILSQFEGVTDYISGMQEKLLKMNEIVIQQSKENSETRNEIRSEVLEIKDNYDRIERDSSTNYRDLKDFKIETRRNIQDLLSQQNTKTVDAYEGQGVKGQLELLEAKIALLEKKLEQSNTDNRSSKRETQESRKYEQSRSREVLQTQQSIRTNRPQVEKVAHEPEMAGVQKTQEVYKSQPAPQSPRPQPTQQPRHPQNRPQNSRIQKPQRPERPTRTEEKPREVVQEESVIDLSDLI